jgi:Fur family transcriptional regulator, peroxide stress response regulator
MRDHWCNNHERTLSPMKPIREIFDQHGLRCTRQREQIYLALKHTRNHPTADELFQMVAEACTGEEAGLSLATVYNALEAFTACGLVRRLPCPTGSGACRFDADTSDHAHVATMDGQLLDVPPDLSAQLLANLPREVLAELERRMGVRVQGVSVQVVAEGKRPGESGEAA